MECRHLNGIKADCSLANLAWGTKAENTEDNHRLKVYPCGADHPMATLTEADVLAIRQRYAAGGITRRELARERQLPFGTVADILCRRSWGHLT